MGTVGPPWYFCVFYAVTETGYILKELIKVTLEVKQKKREVKGK